MQPDPIDSELSDALVRLETALLTPVVSGELTSWAQSAQAALDAVARILPSFLRDVLHEQYAEIAKTDEELLRRVQQMIGEDQQLVTELASYRRRFSAFAEAAALVKKHESKVAEQRDALEQDGVALIVRIKKQRAAADAWLAEAVYRDRGAVD